MTIIVEPTLGVKMPSSAPTYDMIERTDAAARTIAHLHSDEPLPITSDDEDTVANLVHAYAANPEKASRALGDAAMKEMTPASIVLANNVLKEFGAGVAQDATQIRNLVTNKLLIESENPDARIRIKALELLGKISDVGLFTEKREVTITHQSTEDLRNSLRNKLSTILEGEVVDEVAVEGVEYTPPPADSFSKQLEAFASDDIDIDGLADDWDD